MWTLMLFNAKTFIIYCILNQMHLQTIEKKLYFITHLTNRKLSKIYLIFYKTCIYFCEIFCHVLGSHTNSCTSRVSKKLLHDSLPGKDLYKVMVSSCWQQICGYSNRNTIHSSNSLSCRVPNPSFSTHDNFNENKMFSWTSSPAIAKALRAAST